MSDHDDITTRLIDSGDRRATRRIADAEAAARLAEQQRADADAAADRDLRVAEGRLRLDQQRRQVRRVDRGAEREQRAQDRAARRERRRRNRASAVDYVRHNVPAVYSGAVYALAVGGAVYGQITGTGLPLVMAIIVACAIEGIGLSMALTAHQLRLRGERAFAPRALTWAATAAAVAINYSGHTGHQRVILSGLSAAGIVVWEIRSSAKHRATLRTAGQIAEPMTRFGWRCWALYPSRTRAAWRLDIRRRLAPEARALLDQVDADRAAARLEARGAAAARVAARATRHAARKGQAGPALAALVRLADTGQVPALPAGPVGVQAPVPMDTDADTIGEAAARDVSALGGQDTGSAVDTAPTPARTRTGTRTGQKPAGNRDKNGARIARMVRRNPALDPATIAARTGLHIKTVRRHLAALAADNTGDMQPVNGRTPEFID